MLFINIFYIYKGESMHLAGRVCVYVAMQRGRFLWCRAAAEQWGGLFFGVRSEDPLVGKCGVFFGVRSGVVAWQRHLHKIKRFLWGLFWGCCLATTIGR
jgi:hypothetical protein